MTLRWLTAAAIALLLLAGSAEAGNASETRKQAESSLRVSGSIVIRTDGSVLSHEIEPNPQLTPKLTEFLGAAIGGWRFKPVLIDGKPVNAKVPMSLRLVAKQADDGNFSVSIAGTYFGNRDAAVPTDSPRSLKLTPPMFPGGAMQMGAQGTAYLIVQINREGKVANVDAEQVNLRVAGTDKQMNALRKLFRDTAVRAARDWTFTIPTTGEEANKDSWLVRVPVDYAIDGPRSRKRPKDGAGWDTYIPGPRNFDMPWAQDKLRTADSPDAIPEYGVYPLRQGAQLLTPTT